MQEQPNIVKRASRSTSREDIVIAYKAMEDGRAQPGGLAGETVVSGLDDERLVGQESPLVGHDSSLSLKITPTASSESSVYISNQPLNFGVVTPGIYRSSYPKSGDFDFLTGLNLKTIVTLVKKDEVDDVLETFVMANGIRQVIFNMKGTKKEAIPSTMMSSILSFVTDKQNQPLLIHCNHGKHRTGCVVAALRRFDSWDTNMALDEYRTYADPKIRECDVEYITKLNVADLHVQSMISYWHFNVRMNLAGRASFPRFVMFAAVVLALWLLSGRRIGTHTDELVAI